jgi:hypothetical protein
MKRLGLVLGMTLGMLSQPAFAEGPIMRGIEVARACAGDIRVLCPNVRPGEGRIKACIRAKLTLASAVCRDAFGGAGAADEPTDAHFDAVAASVQGPDGGAAAGVAASGETQSGAVVKGGAAVVRP